MERVIIGIDPGATGAVAVCRIDKKGLHKVTVDKIPDSDVALRDYFRELRKSIPSDVPHSVYFEYVGGYRAGNSAIAAATFADTVATQRMAVVCADLVLMPLVAPAKWMKAVGVSYDRTARKEESVGMSKDGVKEIAKANAKIEQENKKKRKAAVLNLVQRQYPDVKICAYAADAVGIMLYGTQQKLT